MEIKWLGERDKPMFKKFWREHKKQLIIFGIIFAAGFLTGWIIETYYWITELGNQSNLDHFWRLLLPW